MTTRDRAPRTEADIARELRALDASLRNIAVCQRWLARAYRLRAQEPTPVLVGAKPARHHRRRMALRPTLYQRYLTAIATRGQFDLIADLEEYGDE